MSKKFTDNFLTCIIDRFEFHKAVLRFELIKNDQQELILAKRYLPRSCKEGDILHLEFLTDKQAKENRKNLAYKILEEILKGNNNGSDKKVKKRAR